MIAVQSVRMARRVHRTKLLDADACDALVSACEPLPWKEAQVTPDARQTDIAPSVRVAEAVHLGRLSQEVLASTGLAALLAHTEAAARTIDAQHLKTGFSRVQNAQLIRYPVGGHYVWHQDAAVPSFRKVSVLVYLSDAASHEVAGGETLFAPWRFLKRWPVAAPPEQGTAVVFDSRVYHCALPTTAGSKTVLLMMFV